MNVISLVRFDFERNEEYKQRIARAQNDLIKRFSFDEAIDYFTWITDFIEKRNE